MILHSKLRFFNVIILFIAVLQTVLYASFIEGTLVKTPQGLVPIEFLRVGNEVISCDLNAETHERSYKNIVVKDITNHIVNDTVLIYTENYGLCTSNDQLFFDPFINQWVAAEALTENNVLINSKLDCFSFTKIEKVPKDCLMYDITLEEPHLLFVTEQEILVHNATPIVVLTIEQGVPLIIKLAPVVFKGVCALAGAIGLYKLFGIGKSKKKDSSQQNQSNKEPDKDPNNKDNRRIVNTITKAEFFRCCCDRYEHWKNGIYKLKERVVGFLNGRAHYLHWDHLHNDVEVYSKNKIHLGSLDPKTLELYKGPVPGRQFPGR